MEDCKQPSTLNEILKLRPQNSDMKAIQPTQLKSRLKAAWACRCAGCTLGVPVENYAIEVMQELAKKSNMEYPPKDYWEEVTDPNNYQYETNQRFEYTRKHLNKVPVDDDITYTVLNLLLLEKYGKNYTLDDVGQLWMDILPVACTAEDEALKELKKGTKAIHAADYNEYVEWIGAAIRADAFGYVEAGNPQGAARLCFNDAYLTHRKNGIYGEMFAAASIAAAFVVEEPLEAIKIGMTQIPKTSELYEALQWALSYEGKLKDYLHARQLIDAKFEGMNRVHTINNMCAVVFALILGGKDVTACLSNSIAMGLDNDCNGATVGSIVGACLGIEKVPEHWYKPFNDTVWTYLRGYPTLSIDDMVERFYKLNQ